MKSEEVKSVKEMKKEKFPGFKNCMELMRKSDSQLREDGYSWLRPHAVN